MKSIEDAAREAATFIDRTTEDPDSVLYIGPVTTTTGGQSHTGVLFVSQRLAEEMFEVERWEDEVLERISMGPLCKILDICLNHQVSAISGQIEEVDGDDFESVAQYVARLGVMAAARQNVEYWGYLRLAQLQPDLANERNRYWFILCKREQPTRNETTRVSINMRLQGCRPRQAEEGEIFRPLSKLIDRFRGPPGELAFVLSAPRLANHPGLTVDDLKSLEDEEYPEEGIRYLGCVARTARGMLSFFPGTPPGPFSLLTTDGEVHEDVEAGHLDHFTLHPDREGWHMTGYFPDGGRLERGEFQTRRASEGLVHWFSLGIKSGNLLYKMREENVVEVEVPARYEPKLRMQVFEALTGAKYRMTSIGDARRSASDSFWYIEVYVAAKPGLSPPINQFFSHGTVGTCNLPRGSPMDVASRRVPIGDSEEELLVLATRLPGNLESEVEIGLPVVRPLS